MVAETLMLRLGFYNNAKRVKALRKNIEYLRSLPSSPSIQSRIASLESEVELIHDVESERIMELADL